MQRLELALAITFSALVFVAACQNASDDLASQPEAEPEATEAGAHPGAEPKATEARHRPADVERAEIIGTVQSLFDALAERDGQAIRDLVHPDVVMRPVERAADGTLAQAMPGIEEIVAQVEGSEDVLTERMFDPEVRISGDLAMVWTPYDFYAGDALSHCGADAVLLARSDDGWQIIGLFWTHLQPPECELHPDGPPRANGG